MRREESRGISMQLRSGWLLIVVVCVSLFACDTQERGRQKTYPVSGKITVDGNPVAGVKVFATGKAKPDPNYPIAPQGTTTADGRFQMYSYEPGDGLPADEYVLTFSWKELRGMRYSGPDKLNGRYGDPAKSGYQVKVDNKPVDVGTIPLTTK
jgi:hypothetical protein